MIQESEPLEISRKNFQLKFYEIHPSRLTIITNKVHIIFFFQHIDFVGEPQASICTSCKRNLGTLTNLEYTIDYS